MNKHFFLCFCIGVLFVISCKPPVDELQTGVWRGVFQTDSAIEIPFNFEVYDSAGTKQVAFLNAPERLNINTVTIEGDSVFISTPMFESELRAKLHNGGMSGYWIRRFPESVQRMSFEAEPDSDWRFVKDPAKPVDNITGSWSVIISRNAGADTTIAVGEFVQDGNQLSGTFRTNYGDYRFLSGSVDGDLLYLSSYAGASPNLFTGKITEDGIQGDFYAGPVNHSYWNASRSQESVLKDAYSMTRLKPDSTTLFFSFQDLNGEQVSITDSRFNNKVIIIQFLGSWCPNCMDETAYLSPFYKKYKSKGVEIIGLAYERYAEPERAKKAVSNLVDRFDITYPVLLTGYTNKDVLKSLPALENFNAFPTTIILDKNRTVRSIHSGFDGPATGEAYTTYTAKFEATINELLAE